MIDISYRNILCLHSSYVNVNCSHGSISLSQLLQHIKNLYTLIAVKTTKLYFDLKKYWIVSLVSARKRINYSFFIHCKYLFQTFRVFNQNHQLRLLEQKLASTNGTLPQVTYYTQFHGAKVIVYNILLFISRS